MLYYISHPNVEIDADVPVPRWGLSEVGRERMQAMLSQQWVATITRVVSSEETKAVEAATILADHLKLEVEVRPNIGENDRSATGFVPPDQFEKLADAFFAEPGVSVHGWERAVDAQQRIVAGLADLLRSMHDGSGDIAVVGHGGVGTLWYCHLAGLEIDRRHDQPGQGNYFVVSGIASSIGSSVASSVASGWQPIEPGVDAPAKV